MFVCGLSANPKSLSLRGLYTQLLGCGVKTRKSGTISEPILSLNQKRLYGLLQLLHKGTKPTRPLPFTITCAVSHASSKQNLFEHLPNFSPVIHSYACFLLPLTYHSESLLLEPSRFLTSIPDYVFHASHSHFAT